MSRSSWWCDSCLSDCHSLQIKNTAATEHWYDFFDWLAKLLATGFAAFVGGLFAIVAFLIGGINLQHITAKATIRKDGSVS